MRSQLKKAIISGEKEKVKKILANFEYIENWSLVTVIDELLSLMVMEGNLRYGNFHFVKMGVFLRRLSIKKYFSGETEKAIVYLITMEMLRRKWVDIKIDKPMKMREFRGYASDNMIEELDRSNTHNAFYYALGIMDEEPNILFRTLLKLGACHVSGTLGHSLTCFYPVVEDIIASGHPSANVALLSYIMYLSRFNAGADVLEENYKEVHGLIDYNRLLKVAASGNGIINLHHMLTLFIFTEWEKAMFNKDKKVPYALVTGWLKGKNIDKEREKRVENSIYEDKLPETFEEFYARFFFEKLDQSIALIFRIIEDSPQKAFDWIFRLYAINYNQESWDAHYYTSLYAALTIYTGRSFTDRAACRMALEQALYYFASGVS